MTLRLIPDDDDRMSANPEEPRADLGYATTTAPRGPRIATGPTHWAIVERPGRAPVDKDAPTTKTCAWCKAEATVLHAPAGSITRSICGKCEGDENRRRVGDARPSPAGGAR